jgi:hypothetical protein
MNLTAEYISIDFEYQLFRDLPRILIIKKNALLIISVCSIFFFCNLTTLISLVLLAVPKFL